jgi:hypothetical protein
MNKNRKLILILMLLLIIPVSFGAVAETWCKGVAYSNACFNGTTGETYLTGVKLNWSWIQNAPSLGNPFDQSLNTTDDVVFNEVTANNLCYSDGTNCTGGDTSGLVPYTGATQNVDLGNKSLTFNNGTKSYSIYGNKSSATIYQLYLTKPPSQSSGYINLSESYLVNSQGQWNYYNRSGFSTDFRFTYSELYWKEKANNSVGLKREYMLLPYGTYNGLLMYGDVFLTRAEKGADNKYGFVLYSNNTIRFYHTETSTSDPSLDYMNITNTGNIWTNGTIKTKSGFLLDNNIKSIYGTSNNASIYYDGSNLIVNPKELGTGKLNVLGNITAPNICYSNGTNCTGGTGGNPFDQVLNTTSNVEFNNVTLTGNVTLSNGQSMTQKVNCTIIGDPTGARIEIGSGC